MGTDASFGIFASETRIILKDGTAKPAAELVEDSHPGDLWHVHVPYYLMKEDAAPHSQTTSHRDANLLPVPLPVSRSRLSK
jgi:hypothetical protein